MIEATPQEKAQREGKTLNADVKGKIIEFLWYLEKQGKTKCTLLNRKYTLQTLQKLGANLFDPESVKAAISKNTKWSLNSKPQIVQNYKSSAKFIKLEWEPPKYNPPENLPFIPLEKELEILIQGSGKRLGAFLQGLKDTGADPGELASFKLIDVNPSPKRWQ